LIKIVLDTNVFISGIIFGGYSKEILEAAVEGKVQLAVSDDILNEISEVLQRKKFNFMPSITRQIISEIEKISEVITPKQSFKAVKRDPADNIIIDCAFEAKADFIITGDKDLLELKEFKNIEIVNPKKFKEEYL
jgi:putative PIN family toxin of toxin-antitoxin system